VEAQTGGSLGLALQVEETAWREFNVQTGEWVLVDLQIDFDMGNGFPNEAPAPEPLDPEEFFADPIVPMPEISVFPGTPMSQQWYTSQNPTLAPPQGSHMHQSWYQEMETPAPRMSGMSTPMDSRWNQQVQSSPSTRNQVRDTGTPDSAAAAAKRLTRNLVDPSAKYKAIHIGEVTEPLFTGLKRDAARMPVKQARSKSIWVGRFPKAVGREDIMQFFLGCGRILHMEHKQSTWSEADIFFSEQEGADLAVNRTGALLGGVAVEVQYSFRELPPEADGSERAAEATGNQRAESDGTWSGKSWHEAGGSWSRNDRDGSSQRSGWQSWSKKADSQSWDKRGQQQWGASRKTWEETQVNSRIPTGSWGQSDGGWTAKKEDADPSPGTWERSAWTKPDQGASQAIASEPPDPLGTTEHDPPSSCAQSGERAQAQHPASTVQEESWSQGWAHGEAETAWTQDVQGPVVDAADGDALAQTHSQQAASASQSVADDTNRATQADQTRSRRAEGIEDAGVAPDKERQELRQGGVDEAPIAHEAQDHREEWVEGASENRQSLEPKKDGVDEAPIAHEAQDHREEWVEGASENRQSLEPKKDGVDAALVTHEAQEYREEWAEVASENRQNQEPQKDGVDEAPLVHENGAGHETRLEASTTVDRSGSEMCNEASDACNSQSAQHVAADARLNLEDAATAGEDGRQSPERDCESTKNESSGSSSSSAQSAAREHSPTKKKSSNSSNASDESDDKPLM